MEAMDMQEFNDPREKTDTCYKLDCNHAYHTKCVIGFLRETNFDCINCNRHKLPKETLTMQGHVMQAMDSVRRQKSIIKSRKSMEHAAKEYRQKLLKLKKEITALVKQRSKETGLKDLKRIWSKKETAYKNSIKRAMLKTSPVTAGVLKELPGWRFMYEFDHRNIYSKFRRNGLFVRI
jgi:hypothetical protein